MEVKKALGLLKKCGVTTVRVEFSGSGDSGQMDGYSVGHRDEINIHGWDYDCVTVPENIGTVSVWVNGKTSVTEFEEALRAVVQALMNKANECDEDWWNNDGGNGEAIVEVSSGKCTLHVNIARTDYDSFSFNYNIKRGD